MIVDLVIAVMVVGLAIAAGLIPWPFGAVAACMVGAAGAWVWAALRGIDDEERGP